MEVVEGLLEDGEELHVVVEMQEAGKEEVGEEREVGEQEREEVEVEEVNQEKDGGKKRIQEANLARDEEKRRSRGKLDDGKQKVKKAQVCCRG